MAAVGRRPRNRVVLGEIDADDVAPTDRDAVARVHDEPAVPDPQRHRHRLTDEPVPVVGRPHRSPDLQVDRLRAPAARRVHVPGDDLAVLHDPLCRVDPLGRVDPLSRVDPLGRWVGSTRWVAGSCRPVVSGRPAESGRPVVSGRRGRSPA